METRIAPRVAAFMTMASSLLLSVRAPAQRPDIPVDSPPGCGACITGPRIGLSQPVVAQQDTGRRKAIEYSGSYNTRLTIHRIASYTELPLFVAEYFVGTKVLDDERDHPGVRSSSKGTHTLIATGLEGLFAVNTVTGVWNLIESRHEPEGRARRWIHGILMLIADAGFAATASAGGSAEGGGTNGDHHRTLALGSMGVATIATVMMWLWKD
jgi:hypothetical protein